MSGWMIASWLLTGPILWDMIRRPEAQWIQGDRRKGVWVVFAVVCLWLFPLSVVLAVGYVVWLLPAFAEPATGSSSGSPSKFSHD